MKNLNFLMSKAGRCVLLLAILTMISTNVWATDDVSTFTNSSFSGLTSHWSSDRNASNYEATRGAQWYGAHAGTTFTATDFTSVTAITVTCAKSSSGAGTITITAGASSKSITSFSTTNTDETLDLSGSPYTGTITIEVDPSANSIYIKKITVTYSSSFTVTYNANGKDGGGAAPSDATAYSSGATVTVLGNPNSMTRTGCTFSGWNTAADGSGTSYAAGATFTISANTTLYAKWAATVTWSDNGGVIRTDNIFVPAAGKSVTPPSDPSTSARGNCGDKFMGWTTTENYKSDSPSPGDIVTGAQTVTGSADYYAVFADYAE